ncbi:NAD(P)H-dependent oxidoreductase [Paenibacillus thailandensis]|uniref:NAD(P)H-dependent oxidoreductase n=1 Tax=Paenibacillus thailandensis TaxID=393250 RepID=A0ABW5R068_9BACL
MAKLLVVYYSAYGHVYEMAKAVCAGAAGLEGTEARMVRVPEPIAEGNITAYLDRDARPGKGGAGTQASGLGERFKLVDRFAKYEAAREAQKDVPIAALDDLRWADGIVWGFPTYYGMMPAQMKLFLDFAGELCAGGELEGKPAGVFTSAGSIHTGHEAAVLTAIVPLLHFGMLFVGLPYSENPEYLTADGIGSSPYGPSTLAGPDSSRSPDERELVMAGRLGARVASIAAAVAPLRRQR